jgi:hypothetical protein
MKEKVNLFLIYFLYYKTYENCINLNEFLIVCIRFGYSFVWAIIPPIYCGSIRKNRAFKIEFLAL